MSHDFAKIRPEPILDRKPVASPPAWSLMFTGVIVGIAIGVFGCVLFYLSGNVPALNGQEVASRPNNGGTATTTASGLTATPIADTSSGAANGAGGTGETSAAAETLNEAADPELTFEFYEVLRNNEVEVDAVPVQLTAEQAARLGIAMNAAGDESKTSPAGEFQQEAQQSAESPANTSSSGADEIGALIASRQNFSTTPNNPSPANNPQGINGRYMLQSGAFQQAESATSQRDRLQRLGLSATIKQQNVTGRTLYLVQAGPYADQGDLESAEQTLRSANINSMRISLR